MEDLESIANEIQERASTSFINMISSLEAKYGNKKRKAISGKTQTAKKRKVSKK